MFVKIFPQTLVFNRLLLHLREPKYRGPVSDGSMDGDIFFCERIELMLKYSFIRMGGLL